MRTLSAAARAHAVETGLKPEFRDVSFEPESYDEATRSIEFTCSSAIQDRHGTIVKQKWRLEWFEQNPIALFGHDSRSPIGKWGGMGVKGGKLKGRLYFAKNDADADKYLNLAAQGVLKAVSVGFIPHSYKWEMHDDIEVLVFDDNELLEVSLVSIGANPEALAKELPLNPAERSATTPAIPAAPAPAAAAPPAPTAPEARQAPEAGGEAIKLAAAAETRAQSAEARALAAETRAQAAETRAATVESELTETRQKLTAAETAAAAAKAAEAVEKARADKLDGARKAAKVEALVGKKYHPVNRAFWLEKCLKDEADFDATMARTDDLPTAVDKQIVDPKDPSPPASSLDPKDVAKKNREAARKLAKEKSIPYHVALGQVQLEQQEASA